MGRSLRIALYRRHDMRFFYPLIVSNDAVGLKWLMANGGVKGGDGVYKLRLAERHALPLFCTKMELYEFLSGVRETLSTTLDDHTVKELLDTDIDLEIRCMFSELLGIAGYGTAYIDAQTRLDREILTTSMDILHIPDRWL